MIRYRQMAVVGALFALLLFAVLLVGVRDAAAQETEVEEPAGSWELTQGILQQEVNVWSQRKSAEILSPMKVDIKDGVLTADYTGPYDHSFGPKGRVWGTVTVSMRGNYAPKTGMSGTLHLEKHGTHNTGIVDVDRPSHLVTDCTFTNPDKLEDGVEYAITLNCSGVKKPAVIAFKVARADVGQGEGPPSEGGDKEPVDQLDPSRPSVEAFAGDIQWCDPEKRAGFVLNQLLGLRAILRGSNEEEQFYVWEKPRIGKDLEVGDLIRTGTGAARITFKDGTKFLLRPGSRLKVRDFGFEVQEGGIHYEYEKVGKEVRLISRRSDFSIIGTAFSVETSGENDTLKVFKGRVEVSLLKDPAEKVAVEQGQEVTVTDDAISSKRSVDVEEETGAWNDVEKAAQGSTGGCSLDPAVR